MKIKIKDAEELSAAFLFAFLAMVGIIIGAAMAISGAKDFDWQFWVGGILSIICAPIMGFSYDIFSQKIIENKKLNK